MSEMTTSKETTTRNKKGRWGTVILSVALIAGLALFAKGYFGNESTAGTLDEASARPALPSVVVQAVELADLAAEKSYIGRIEPIQTVSLKPQVAGEIEKVHFTEGSLVKAGDVLFTLDSKQYQATVDLRKADLAKAEANYNYATQYYNRLKASDKRSVSASDIESAENQVKQAQAAISQAKASLRLAQIDLGYTKITAPISGQIGRAEFTKGNYVTPSSGTLANIVQVNPIRVSFAVPDRDYLSQIEAFKTSNDAVYRSEIVLPDGSTYPQKGEREFEDNVMDNRTGTITMHLRFPNEQGTLVPGTVVQVETKPVQSHIASVIPQEAIMADTEGDFVYVVDGNNVVQNRRVEIGAEAGYMSEVLSGLQAGEQVIVRGHQSVRPQMEVKTSPLKMESATLSPAELAKKSGYDLKTLPAAGVNVMNQETPQKTVERKS